LKGHLIGTLQAYEEYKCRLGKKAGIKRLRRKAYSIEYEHDDAAAAPILQVCKVRRRQI
jgi:hypothetical protein